MLKKTRKYFYYCLIFCAVAIASEAFYTFNKNPENNQSCLQLLAGFEEALKSAVIKDYKQECHLAGSDIERAGKLWNELASARKSGDCFVFPAGKKAERAIYTLNEGIERAFEASQEKKHAEACRLILKAKSDFVALAKQGSHLRANSDIVDLVPEINKIGRAAGKADADAILSDLKYKFTQLKQHQIDGDYARLLASMEDQIAILDRSLDGPDWKKAQSDLTAQFWEMYYKY